jgi:hypothetical protein
MYAQQASIDPSLAALLQTAQMVTPDGGRTVAANVAQAAAQKLQPQGIAQGMPEARQDFQDAMPSMMRNMQQQQMQQMVQQAMQPKPAGIEGLPSNIRMAEGGVVGYAGPDGSSVEVDESQLSVSERLKRGLRRLYEGIETGYMKRAGATPEQIAQKLGQESPAAAPEVSPQAMQTEAAFATPRIDQPIVARVPAPAPQAPAPRPPAQRPPAAAQQAAPAQTAPQGGIAELVAPTPESAMASARSVLGMPGTEGLRKREEAYLAALKAQPATGQQGLAALQAQQAALQAMNEKAEKESNINSAIQWLLGGREGAGGSARSSIAFSEREDARRRSYNDLQVANATKRDAIIDLQNARDVGNAKAALEAEQRIRAAEVDVAKAEATLAASFASSQANVYGEQMRGQSAAADRASREREGELNRAQNERLERIRKATANQPGETERIFAEYTRRKSVDPKDAEAYLANIERIKGLGKGLGDRAEAARERNAIARQKLMNEDQIYASARMSYINATDPAKKAEALRKMKEIERLNGIVEESSASSGAPQGTVDKNNPLLK